MSSDQEKWAENYKQVSENPPEVGTVLTTLSGEPVKLTAELKKGSPPFIFGRALVPDLFGEELGWYLRDADDRSYHGWRAVLLPRARVALIQKLGLGELNSDGSESVILVKSLRLIRYSNSKNSMLCEVHEYCEEPVPADLNMAHPASDETIDTEVREAETVPATEIFDSKGKADPPLGSIETPLTGSKRVTSGINDF